MIDLILIGLFASQVGLLIIIAALVADNNRISRENQNHQIDAAWCRAIVDTFVGKVERPK